MDQDKVFYFNGNVPVGEVRVLIFNDSINLYSAEGESFIKAFPIKEVSVDSQEQSLFIFFNDKAYLQLASTNPLADILRNEISDAGRSFVKKLVRQRMLWFAVILVGIIAGLYLLIVSLVPYIGGAIISRDHEISIGKQLKDVMLAEEKISGAAVDSAGTIRLQAFADKVKLSNNYPIGVTLVNSSTVNAYALPGGQIIVYSGMLNNIAEPGELVALLAHEASHVNRRHSLRAMLRSAADALVLAILFNDVSAVAAIIIGNAQNLRGLDYSRSAEKEADEYGMRIMLENDINVSGMKKLMQILQKQENVPDSYSFLSSHPLTKKRIEAADDFIRKHPQKNDDVSNLQTLFRQLKQ